MANVEESVIDDVRVGIVDCVGESVGCVEGNDDWVESAWSDFDH